MPLQRHKEDTEEKQSASVCTNTKNPCCENKSCIQTFIIHRSTTAIFIIVIIRIDHCCQTFIVPPLWTLTPNYLPLLWMWLIHWYEGHWVSAGPLITTCLIDHFSWLCETTSEGLWDSNRGTWRLKLKDDQETWKYSPVTTSMVVLQLPVQLCSCKQRILNMIMTGDQCCH